MPFAELRFIDGLVTSPGLLVLVSMNCDENRPERRIAIGRIAGSHGRTLLHEDVAPELLIVRSGSAESTGFCRLMLQHPYSLHTSR